MPSWLSPQWLCGNSWTWTHDIIGKEQIIYQKTESWLENGWPGKTWEKESKNFFWFEICLKMNIYPLYISKYQRKHDKKNHYFDNCNQRRITLSWNKRIIFIIKRNNVKTWFFGLNCLLPFKTKKNSNNVKNYAKIKFLWCCSFIWRHQVIRVESKPETWSSTFFIFKSPANH